MPALLMYNLEGERARRLRMIAMMLKIRVRPVAPEEYGERLAALAGLEAPAGAPAEAPFDGEMLVFAEFSNALLDRFLSEMKRAKLSVALKAVLTPTNAQWTSARLRGELDREREALRAGRAAHKKEDNP